MSNTPDMSSFGKFVPGFDFLQNLAKQAAGGAAQSIPQLPNLGQLGCAHAERGRAGQTH